MLEDIAKNYYKQGFNCAESLVRAGNDLYELGLHDHDMKMIAGFGGGLQCQDICGAMSGAICVISSKFVQTKAHDCQCLKEHTVQFIQRFEEKFQSRLCKEIKPQIYDIQDHCLQTVAITATILEEVIIEWEKKN